MLNQIHNAQTRIQDAMPDFKEPLTPAQKRRHDCIQVIFDCWKQGLDALETIRTLKERGFTKNMANGQWRRTAIYTWFCYFRKHKATGPIAMRRAGNRNQPAAVISVEQTPGDLVDQVLASSVSDARAREIIRGIRAGHIKAINEQLCTMEKDNILLLRRDVFANEDKPEVMLDFIQAKAVLEGLHHIRAFVAGHK